MKFTNKKVIIFDLDGTLIDSAPDLALAINHMLTKLNRKTFSSDTIRYWVGSGAETLIKRALSGGLEIDETIEKSLWRENEKICFDFYAKNSTINTVTYPHVVSSLQKLKEHGFILAIVTNKPFSFIDPILKALHLSEFFKIILGADSLEKKKPNPMPLLHVCDKLGFSVEQAVMVGDSKSDILAGHACNMQTIGVSYGYNYDEDISTYNPNIILDNFSDILTVLID